MMKLLLALFIISFSAQAAETATCGKEAGPHPYGWCISETKESKNQDVLYFFHGGGGNGEANSWTQDPAFVSIKDQWKEAGYDSPRVIEVSFGPIWLLLPKGKKNNSGLLEFFVDEVMPKMEAKLSGGNVAKRKLLGHSMGGLNGAELIMQRPELFQAAALMAPSFLGISPFADAATQKEYEQSRGMREGWATNVMKIARAYVENEEEWNKVSPTIIAPKKLSNRSADILVSVGRKDVMFYEEAKLFAAQAKQAGAFVILDDHEEGHGYVSAAAIASFLSLPL
jgi:hypothetical protein